MLRLGHMAAFPYQVSHLKSHARADTLMPSVHQQTSLEMAPAGIHQRMHLRTDEMDPPRRCRLAGGRRKCQARRTTGALAARCTRRQRRGRRGRARRGGPGARGGAGRRAGGGRGGRGRGHARRVPRALGRAAAPPSGRAARAPAARHRQARLLSRPSRHADALLQRNMFAGIRLGCLSGEAAASDCPDAAAQQSIARSTCSLRSGRMRACAP